MSIERHSRDRQVELGRALQHRSKVYLDTRFWIIARDAALGVRTDASSQKLLHYLRRGVATGQLVCPISASMFLELMKQPYTPGRRIGTAELIDELSLGVSIIPPQIMTGTEIRAFFLRATGETNLYSMQELVWTKVAYVLGDIYPSLAQLSPADELALQKAFFDHMWGLSLTDIVATIGDDFGPPDPFEKLSRETNEQNAEHKGELRSFSQTYDAELRGAVDVSGPTAADVIHNLAEKEAGRALSPTPEERRQSENAGRNLLYHAFKKPETKLALRTLHIGATIHAAMRWDKDRKFKANDYYDFQHAIAALSYCDVFLTERPLHDLVTQAHTNLGAINDCSVIFDTDAAVTHIRQLPIPAEKQMRK